MSHHGLHARTQTPTQTFGLSGSPPSPLSSKKTRLKETVAARAAAAITSNAAHIVVLITSRVVFDDAFDGLGDAGAGGGDIRGGGECELGNGDGGGGGVGGLSCPPEVPDTATLMPAAAP